MIEDHFRGYVIWIGRNQDENDELVTKASPEDYWLHLASVPSPHCIIDNPSGKRIHHKIIKHAAYLTKKYSKYSHVQKIDVCVTRIKFIKKTNKKGLVTVLNLIKIINS
uniref:NFACT RNA-binding domain-containing protein n=1 Tax=viral metagenome TaxID=1070528 RepID=A0A6C0C6P6_9ZZZZ